MATKNSSAGTSTRSGKRRAAVSKKDQEFLKERIEDQFGKEPKPKGKGKKGSAAPSPSKDVGALPSLSPKETSVSDPSSSTTEGVNIFGESYPIGQLPEGLPPEFKPLSKQQQLFVVYYAVTRNGVEAVKMAGYKGTYESMMTQAWRMLRTVEILKAYDAYMRPEFEKQGVTVQRVVEHTADIAFSPWSEHLLVKEKKGRIVAVKMQMSAKTKALELLMKMLRLTSDKEIDIAQFIDQSQNIHVHAETPDAARQALLSYLRKRK